MKRELCMVMEFCARGSLYDVLQDDSVEMGWQRSFQMLEEIVTGLQALHNHTPCVMHRDLKTLNVLVTQDFHCRLADFGLSRFDTASNLKTLAKCAGTYAYTAPESMDSATFRYTVRSDVYSVAIMMWEFAHRCVTGCYKRPYYEMSVTVEFTFLLQAANKNRRPKIPDNVPPTFLKLITDTWHKDPNQRPDSNQLLERLQAIHKEYEQNKEKWDALSTAMKPVNKEKKKPQTEDDNSTSSEVSNDEVVDDDDD